MPVAFAVEAAAPPAQAPVPAPVPIATSTPTPEPPHKTVALSELVKAALEQNLTLSGARASTRSTETSISSARGQYDPTLDFSPAYNNASQELRVQGSNLSGTQSGRVYSGGATGRLPISTSYSLRFDTNRSAQDNTQLLAPGVLSPTLNNTLTFQLTQPLLRGVGPKYQNAPVDLAEYSVEAAEARLRRTTDQTIADVETAYWTLGLSEAIERLSRDSYTRAQDLLGRNEKMLNLKLISELDAITSRRGVQQRLTSLTDATRRRQDAAERLLFLVYGRQAGPHMNEIDMVRTEPVPALAADAAPKAMADAEALAVKQRQDLTAAKADLSQSQLLTSVNKNATLPDLRLTGTYTQSVLNTDSMRFFDTGRDGDLKSSDWKIGVSFTYPIGNRTAGAAYAKAKADSEVSADNLAATENLVRNQARASVRAIETNRQRLEQAQRSFDYAKQQYDAGQKQLQLGLLDSFRLLQMEEDVSNTELTLEQTRYDLVQAMTDYALATGTIGQRYGASTQAK
jgi:outer membrane protein TolC